MLHNASLMIDDIEDGSTLRRGAPAAHMVYGVPLTINAAELTCFLAMQKAMQLNHPLVAHIMISKSGHLSLRSIRTFVICFR